MLLKQQHAALLTEITADLHLENVSGMHGVVIQDVLDRDRLVSTKRRGKTATGRPAHQVRYSAEAQQRRQLKLAKPMLSSLRASASVVVA